jgi:hypothetical protein
MDITANLTWGSTLEYPLSGLVTRGGTLYVEIANITPLTGLLSYEFTTVPNGTIISQGSAVSYINGSLVITLAIDTGITAFNQGNSFYFTAKDSGNVVQVEACFYVGDTAPDAPETAVVSSVDGQTGDINLNYKQYKVSATIGAADADYLTDGTADNVEFQAALNAINTAGGGTLFVKKGTYNFSSEVTIYGNTTVEGDEGAIINAAGAKPISGLRFAFKTNNTLGKENISFINLKIIGDYTDGTGSTFAVYPAVGGILVNGTTGVLIRDCTFERCWNDVTTGISSTAYDASLTQDNTKKVWFINNRSMNTLGGMQCYSTTEVLWDGNYFENFGDDAIAFLTINHTEAKAIIVNNTFKNGRPQNSNGVYGVGIGVKIDGSATPRNLFDIVINNNNFESCHEGIWISNGVNYTISNNTFRNTYRIAVKLADKADEGEVSNNILVANNTQNSDSNAPIYINGSTNIKVLDNIIKGANQTNEKAIRVGGTSANIEIRRNTITNSGNVLFDCNAVTNLVVTDNLLTAASNTSRFMLLNTVSAPVVFARNQMTGAVTAAESVYITNTPSLSVLDNEMYAVNNQFSVDASIITRLIVRGNTIRNFTGNTIDGHAVFRISNTQPSDTIVFDRNIVQNNDSTYYLGINISSNNTISRLQLTNNIVTGNKYGVSINSSSTIIEYINSSNIINNNTSYNLNEFATTFTTKRNIIESVNGNSGFGTSSPSGVVDINSNLFRVRTAKTPSSASDTGNTGDICWDSSYVYVCVATNTWKRSAIATW